MSADFSRGWPGRPAWAGWGGGPRGPFAAWAFGRMRGRGPWGRSGAGLGWDPRGPRVRRGDVRTAVLALLAESPMHGYQVIHELEKRSGGAWRVSPGSVYPTLQLLE